MTPTLFRTLLLTALFAAAPAFAQSSPCAALPEAGRIGTPGSDRIATPVPNPDRTLRCPDDFRLDSFARPPRCTAPGITPAEGSPRAACYAALPLGPLAPLPVRSRPTRSCDTATTVTILRLTGPNIGLADAVLTVVPADGITATTLTAIGGEVPVAEDPVVQGCFGHDCRLVKLEITARAAPTVSVRVTMPGQPYVDQRLDLPEYCPRQ